MLCDVNDRGFRRAVGNVQFGQLEPLVGPPVGLVEECFYLTPTDTSPPVFQTYIPSVELSELGHEGDATITAGGKGQTLRNAILSGVGEFLERNALKWPVTADSVEATARELSRSDKSFCSVESVNTCPEGALPSELTAERSIRWCRGLSIRTGSESYVPAQLVYESIPGEQRYAHGSSNGAAVGSSFVDATLGGFTEVVERHALLAHWFTGTAPERIDLRDSDHLAALKDWFERDGHRFELLYYGKIANLHAVGAAVTRRTGTAPEFVLAGAAAETLDEAIVDSLVEGAQLWNDTVYRIHDWEEITDPELRPGQELTLSETVVLHSFPENQHRIEWFLQGPKRPLDSLGRQELPLGRTDLSPTVVDITTPSLEAIGWTGVKVFVPELLPLTSPSTVPRKHPRLDGMVNNSWPHPLG